MFCCLLCCVDGDKFEARVYSIHHERNTSRASKYDDGVLQMKAVAFDCEA